MIICAAIKITDDVVAVGIKPARHCDIIRALAHTGYPTPIDGEQGFLTDKGEFLDRAAAKDHAQLSGQVKETEFRQLYTEDLW
jgi:uncharacterized protein (DUF169 family)